MPLSWEHTMSLKSQESLLRCCDDSAQCVFDLSSNGGQKAAAGGSVLKHRKAFSKKIFVLLAMQERVIKSADMQTMKLHPRFALVECLKAEGF